MVRSRRRAFVAALPLAAVLLATGGCSTEDEEESLVATSDALGVNANGKTPCSCTSPTDCRQIGTLSVPGHKSQPIYCNRLNGAMNPGVQGTYAWLYQCMELANRFVVDSLGSPIIRGASAYQMCDSADRASYDVHYGNSSHVPEPGDLLVWDGYTDGHVAVVSKVSADAITVAQQNFGFEGNEYPFVTTPRLGNFFGAPWGDNGLRAKCLIHPKKLDAPVRGEVSCAPGGLYCGSGPDLPKGKYDARTLFRCDASGTSLSVAERCAEGCFTAPSGHDDRCIERSVNWSSPDNESTIGARGCGNSRGTDGEQHWTCNVAANGHPEGDGNLYRCEADGSARYVKCTNGCAVQPINTDDFCK